MTSALVVDDHPIVFQGIRRVLQDMGVESVHEAPTVAVGYRTFLRQQPDVVILDLSFNGDDLGGLTLIQRLTSLDRRVRMIVFSMHNDPTIVARALESGALGYVLKDTPPSELAAAFQKVIAGEPFLTHKLALQVAMLRSKGEGSSKRSLSTREIQILALVGKGDSYERIAGKLGISYKTVANTCCSMRAKLQLDSLADLIRFAISNESGGVRAGTVSDRARE